MKPTSVFLGALTSSEGHFNPSTESLIGFGVLQDFPGGALHRFNSSDPECFFYQTCRSPSAIKKSSAADAAGRRAAPQLRPRLRSAAALCLLFIRQRYRCGDAVLEQGRDGAGARSQRAAGIYRSCETIKGWRTAAKWTWRWEKVLFLLFLCTDGLKLVFVF